MTSTHPLQHARQQPLLVHQTVGISLPLTLSEYDILSCQHLGISSSSDDEPPLSTTDIQYGIRSKSPNLLSARGPQVRNKSISAQHNDGVHVVICRKTSLAVTVGVVGLICRTILCTDMDL